MNLHAITRNLINGVAPDEPCLLIQALGQTNVKGLIKPQYTAGEIVIAQVQTLSPDELQATNDALRTSHLRKFYLQAATNSGHKPQGQMRVKGKPEDFIFRIMDRTFWKIYQVAEDFDNAGWVSVGAALQVQVPDEVRAGVPTFL